ncbi:MAG TPA: cupredoxin family copper-binding protein [Tepidisphaeraceae bacterium]|jgi:plastocyanin|nr:cupredoxin family copper-binding protein [Tepidisphaeraceae bacterium]
MRVQSLKTIVLAATYMVFVAIATAAPADKKEPAHARKEVSIANLTYTPATLKIHVGDTVVWTNNDDRDHTVIAADGSFKSPNIKSGQTYEYTFTKAGKFSYGCIYHPRMKGTIVVE